MTFQKCASLYLELNEDEWKPSYFDKNRRIINKRFDEFQNMNIQDIRASHIKLWYKKIDTVGNKSKRNYLSVLKGILDVALEDEIIDKNPMVHVALPKYHAPRIKPFTSDDVQRILKGAEDYNFNLVYLLAMGFFTGMRTGEILALKRADIDFEKRVIHIRSTISRFGDVKPKTFGSIRDIPILDTLYPYIVKMFEKENDNYMMTTQYGNPYHDTHIFCNYWWKPLLIKLGIEYRRPYNMRHTFATNMLYKGLCTPAELAQYLGHSTTRMIYEVYVSYIEGHFTSFKTDILLYL